MMLSPTALHREYNGRGVATGRSGALKPKAYRPVAS